MWLGEDVRSIAVPEEFLTFIARGPTLDIRFCRLKSIPALKVLQIYNGHLWWFQIENTKLHYFICNNNI